MWRNWRNALDLKSGTLETLWVRIPPSLLQEINMESNHIRSSMIERNSMEEFVVTLYDEDGNNVATYSFQNYKDAENCVKKWYEHD